MRILNRKHIVPLWRISSINFFNPLTEQKTMVVTNCYNLLREIEESAVLWEIEFEVSKIDRIGLGAYEKDVTFRLQKLAQHEGNEPCIYLRNLANLATRTFQAHH
ncbi:MAG: hypothetical protein ACI86H_000724 [bacterium]|jgi:hypothetical protein